MIKSIKLANSYPTTEVGFIAKDLSSVYNFEFNTNFSIVILNSFFEELLKDNTVKNRISSLLQNINENTDIHQIKEISETITTAIEGCDFSEELKENLSDAYETLPWKSNVSAKDLLDSPEHKVNIIGSPDYITAPLIFFGIEKNSLEETIKKVYAHYFSVEEIIYRINSGINENFSIAVVIQKEEPVSVSALCYISKTKETKNQIKVYVFPGLINIKDIEKPDQEVKPDQYVVSRDSLKLDSSVAGKQTFKNISKNGEYKRVECQIKSFILNDAIASEIARLTKKAGVLLEKAVQIIFTITNDRINIMHISNTIDLQKDYFNKTQLKTDFVAEETKEETPEIDEEPEEEILKEEYEEQEEISEIKDFDRVEPNSEDIASVPEPKAEETTTELESENQDIPKAEDFTIKENNKEQDEETPEIDEETNTPENVLDSDKPLSELMESAESTEEVVDEDIEMPENPEAEDKTENQEEQKEENQEPEQTDITNSEPISLLDEPEEKAENILDNNESEEKQEDNDDFLM